MAKARKAAPADLPAQRDPAAPLDASAFLRAAQPTLRRLTEDLLARADASPHVTAALKRQHAAALKQHRTAEEYIVWRRAVVTQVAAAWLLSCVFIRVLEDRGLIHARLAGPAARDSEAVFFQIAPSLTHREYLLTLFRELSHLPAASDLFDARHNLVWRLAPSDAACKDLLNLFRTPSIEAPAFRFGQADTRFLGDLYQHLDADVREYYALLQTPDFVESFILDHTLEPAIREYGIDHADIIDPTCGSGHFLLGAFPRFLDHLRRAHPAEDDRELARRALDKIYGVDINPYAASIARFRLFLKFVEVGQYRSLRETPKPPIHVVPADSLLYGFAGGQGDFGEREDEHGSDAFGVGFNLEDAEGARQILAKRTYAAVVGNPPYITVKDAALREKYRKQYTAAAGKYALSAPFMQRFFALAKSEGGYIGQITANSFMKREFGKALVERVLRELDLTYIVNTAGAFIPGHDTPTVIVFGRNRKLDLIAPRGKVLAVLAKRGEAGVPSIPAEAPVWRSIAEHGLEIGFDNEFISVDEINRTALDQHPWALEGGAAGKLKEHIEKRGYLTLAEMTEAIGFDAIMGEDELFIADCRWHTRLGVSAEMRRMLVEGGNVRDWAIDPDQCAIFPYDDKLAPSLPRSPAAQVQFWTFRKNLTERYQFGKSIVEAGLEWFEYRSFYKAKRFSPLSIAYAEVATHNHFVLDRGGKVFKQTAPIIKLPATATEDDYLTLLAYLNSSTACFWLKQVAFNKGSRGQGGGLTSEEWEQFYQFSSNKLGPLPLPPWSDDQRKEAATRSRAMLALADERLRLLNISQLLGHIQSAEELSAALDERRSRILELENRLRAAQESLDWWIYGLFGLSAPELAAPDRPRSPGQRLSDIRFARGVVGGAAGIRYFQLCRLPSPAELAASPLSNDDPLVNSRSRALDASPYLRLLETPTYKRTFREGFRDPDFERQTEIWLLDQIELAAANVTAVQPRRLLMRALPSQTEPVLSTMFQEKAVQSVLDELLRNESIPFLAAYRYGPSGREKHIFWRQVWDLQRQADALDVVAERDPTRENRHKASVIRATIPVPPSYEPADFRDGNFYRLRGKLDVPKERFISYPGCASDTDQEPVYGWAGWNHLQRALALFQLYYARKDEAWTPDRLIPMLAGLEELLPWVRQWHADERSPETGQLYHEYFDQVIDSEAAELGCSRTQLADWAPPERNAGRKPAKSAKPADDEEDAEQPAPRARKARATASADETGEPAPARKPRKEAQDATTTDTPDAKPARKRRSKASDNTPPASE